MIIRELIRRYNVGIDGYSESINREKKKGVKKQVVAAKLSINDLKQDVRWMNQ